MRRTPAAPLPPTADAHRSILAPYLACLAVLVALLPVEGTLRLGEVAAGMAIQAVAALAVFIHGRLERGASPLAFAGILLFLASVALLRDGAGTGYGPLVLLPVIWSALRGRRSELAVSIGGAALIFAVPLVLVGAPAYPPASARAGILIVVVATVIGVAVLGLVERLRASNDRATAILGAMSEGFALTRDGEIVAVNTALCRITGLNERELLGARPPFPFWPPELYGEAEEVRRRVVASGGSEFELTLMRAGGERFPASITCAPADLGDGSVTFVNTVRDITERRAHDDAMRRRADELAAIASVTRAMGQSDPDDARRTICQVAVDVTGASAAALWEADADDILHNTWTINRPRVSAAVGHDQPDNGSRVAWRTARPLFVPCADGSPHVDQGILRAYVGSDSPNASLYFRPIGDVDAVRGVLVLSWTPAIDQLPDEVNPLLDVIAGEAATAMQRADLLNQLAELSRTDELTGLPNRRAWEELLDREMRVARRTGQPLSVVMLDLDHFKAYNDHHGHQGGDRLLWLAANLWRDSLRDTDVLARWGGEEFGLLLPGCDAVCAGELVQRLHDLPLDGLTFSAGVSEWDRSSASQALIGQADAALYAAKRGGRNRTCTASAAAAA
jgi:diguanylate cyclase (GGDEF)-like protein/PAS domain S-box-containing protein